MDEQARMRLIADNIRFAYWVVGKLWRKWNMRGCPDDDANQTGMLGLVRAVTDYDPDKASLRTYAYFRIRRELATEILKRRLIYLPEGQIKDKHDKIQCVSLWTQKWDDKFVEYYNPSEGMEQQEQVEQLQRVLEFLPEETVEYLRLRHYEGLSFRDIAEKMNKPFTTVRSAVAKGYIRLRKILSKEEERAAS